MALLAIEDKTQPAHSVPRQSVKRYTVAVEDTDATRAQRAEAKGMDFLISQGFLDATRAQRAEAKLAPLAEE